MPHPHIAAMALDIPKGWVVMRGPQGLVVVHPTEVPEYEREGYWLAHKMPKVQDAPGDAVPMDTERGRDREEIG